MAEDFSETPVSLTEFKANKTCDASLWTPRDALIAALRILDSGEWKPDKLLIAGITHAPDDIDQIKRFFAGGRTLDLIGLFEMAKLDAFANS